MRETSQLSIQWVWILLLCSWRRSHVSQAYELGLAIKLIWEKAVWAEVSCQSSSRFAEPLSLCELPSVPQIEGYEAGSARCRDTRVRRIWRHQSRVSICSWRSVSHKQKDLGSVSHWSWEYLCCCNWSLTFQTNAPRIRRRIIWSWLLLWITWQTWFLQQDIEG